MWKHNFKVLTAPKDLHKSHIRNFQSRHDSSYKSQLRLGHSPHKQTLWETWLLHRPSLIDCMANIGETQDQVSPPWFATEHINELQYFEWLIVQHNITAPCHYKGSPEWTAAYTQSNFGLTEKRLFGINNYDYFIGTIRTLLATTAMNRNSHLKATYNPDPYLLWGQGFLWYTALMRPRIHTNALHICSTIADQWMHQELCIEEDNIFTYSKYYLLLQNAAYEVGVNHCDKELLCYIWQPIAGPIWWYIDDPLLEFWFPDTFYTAASDFMHLNPQTWPSQGRPDCADSLGPEHCHQALCPREGSVFPKTR